MARSIVSRVSDLSICVHRHAPDAPCTGASWRLITTHDYTHTCTSGHARRLVFERALDDLCARFPDAPLPTRLIVDGTLFGSWRDVPHECVPRADATVPTPGSTAHASARARNFHARTRLIFDLFLV